MIQYGHQVEANTKSRDAALFPSLVSRLIPVMNCIEIETEMEADDAVYAVQAREDEGNRLFFGGKK